MRTAQPDRDHKRIPEPRACDGLSSGRWIGRGGIQVYVFDQPRTDRITADPMLWPTITLCAVCDTAHHVAETCPTCLAWAERDAEQWSWQRTRRANRHVIWTILDARKSVAA